MKQKYKVFLKNHSLEFVQSDTEESGESDKNEMIEALSENKILQRWSISEPTQNLEFRSHNPDAEFKEFINRFEIIEACGGIVKIHDRNVYLLIKRMGVWDLPKGKKDDGETDEETAIREVREECGLNELKVLGFVDTTFHIFVQNGRIKIKKTKWFEMECSNSFQLHPQSEEEITEAIWADESKADELLIQSYHSIWNLWQHYKNSAKK